MKVVLVLAVCVVVCTAEFYHPPHCKGKYCRGYGYGRGYGYSSFGGAGAGALGYYGEDDDSYGRGGALLLGGAGAGHGGYSFGYRGSHYPIYHNKKYRHGHYFGAGSGAFGAGAGAFSGYGAGAHHGFGSGAYHGLAGFGGSSGYGLGHGAFYSRRHYKYPCIGKFCRRYGYPYFSGGFGLQGSYGDDDGAYGLSGFASGAFSGSHGFYGHGHGGSGSFRFRPFYNRKHCKKPFC